MAKWKQVDGDRDFAGTGCTLARANRAARTVELVRITPWLELDSSAMREGYGLWDVSSTYVDYSEMGVDKKTVKDALKTIDMDEDDYRRLSPEHKAAIIAEYSGYEGSESVSDFGKALPVPLKQIEFYAGTGLDEELQALRFAASVAAQSYTWDEPKAADKKLSLASVAELQFVLKMLLGAPPSKDLPGEAIDQLAATYARHFELDWEDKNEQVRSMIDDDSENARRLGRDILEELGF